MGMSHGDEILPRGGKFGFEKTRGVEDPLYDVSIVHTSWILRQVFRNSRGPGLWRPERSEGAIRGLRTVGPDS